MAFVCRAGATAEIQFSTSKTPHLYILLTNPYGKPRNVIWINVTTPNRFSDTRIILTPADHPYLIYESVLSYENCAEVPITRFPILESEGKLMVQPDISPSLLNEIQCSISASGKVGMGLKLKLDRLAAKEPAILIPPAPPQQPPKPPTPTSPPGESVIS